MKTDGKSVENLYRDRYQKDISADRQVNLHRDLLKEREGKRGKGARAEI